MNTIQTQEERTNNAVNALIGKAIELERKTAFTPEYAAKASDSEVMGIIIAHHFKWSGRSVAETTFAGLEDSNFHAESKLFNEMWKKNNPGESDLWITSKEREN